MRLNNKGFSLIEVMISMAIGVILAGIATFAFIEAISLFNRSIRQSQAEADMLGAMYMIKSTYAQSVLVKYGGQASVANNAQTKRGVAVPKETSFGTLFRYPDAGNADSTFLISLTNKEMAVDITNSKFFAVGVYYRRYQTAKSGALFFDMEASPGGWAKLSPINAVSSFGRFTDFAVEYIRVLNTDGTITEDAGAGDTNKPVLSAEFKLAMRYFTRGAIADWKWCPIAIAASGACISNANYYDIEKRVKVTFANNSFSDSKYLPTRPFGNLYFFKTIGPTIRR